MAVLAVVFAALLATSGTASAAVLPPPPIPTGRDCLNPPMPADPFAGQPANIDPGPTKPVAGDPFAKGTNATMYDRYGYAGYNLGIFDIPNKMDICQPIVVDADQRFANAQLDLALAATAVAVRLTRTVTTGTFGAIWDPVQQTLTASLGGKLFLGISGVALMAAAIWVVLVRARTGQLAHVASWTGTALLIFTISVGCVFYAVGVGSAVDRGMATAFTAAGDVVTNNGREPADVVGSTMVDYVVYPTWQRNMFGNNEAARNEFSERLWKAGALTKEEQTGINTNPDTAAAVLDDRQEQYKAVMVELEEKYPQSYQIASGMDTRSQLGDTTAGTVAVFVAVWFLIACLLMLLWSSVIVRIGIGMFPAVAIPALFPRMHKLASDVGMMILQALWRAVVSAFAFFAFVVAGVGWVMRSDAPAPVKILAVAFMTVAGWRFMKRFGVTPNMGAIRNRVTNLRKNLRTDGPAYPPVHGKSGSDTQGKPGPTVPGKPGAPGAAGQPGTAGASVPSEARVSARQRAVSASTSPLNLGPLQSATRPTTAGVPGTPGTAGRTPPTAPRGNRKAVDSTTVLATAAKSVPQLRAAAVSAKVVTSVNARRSQVASARQRQEVGPGRSTTTEIATRTPVTVPKTSPVTPVRHRTPSMHGPASTAVIPGTIVRGYRKKA